MNPEVECVTEFYDVQIENFHNEKHFYLIKHP